MMFSFYDNNVFNTSTNVIEVCRTCLIIIKIDIYYNDSYIDIDRLILKGTIFLLSICQELAIGLILTRRR